VTEENKLTLGEDKENSPCDNSYPEKSAKKSKKGEEKSV